MLNVHNFAQGTVSTGYDAAATSIVLTTGHGARFPSAGPFRCVWWNQTDHPNPADDANREIVEVTARTTDTLTVVRGMETSFGGLAASTKNTAAKTYGMALVQTAEGVVFSGNPMSQFITNRDVSRWFHLDRHGMPHLAAPNGATTSQLTEWYTQIFHTSYGPLLYLATGFASNGVAYAHDSLQGLETPGHTYLLSQFSRNRGVFTFRVPILSDGTDGFYCALGFGVRWDLANAEANFVGIRLNGSTLEPIAVSGGSLTVGTGSLAYTANTALVLFVDYTPGVGAKCYSDGVYFGEITTGLPATSTGFVWYASIVRNVGTSNTRELQIGRSGYLLTRA